MIVHLIETEEKSRFLSKCKSAMYVHISTVKRRCRHAMRRTESSSLFEIRIDLDGFLDIKMKKFDERLKRHFISPTLQQLFSASASIKLEFVS